MIKYPNKGNSKSKSTISTSNRGMLLEDAINQTNTFYLSDNRAVIYKKPTPVQIVKVDYPHRSAAKIVEAYFKIPSTTDYNGLYNGHYIDFEVKQVANKTKFILKNVHDHQFKHLEKVIEHGGIGFFIIGFTYQNEVYLIDANYLIDLYHKDIKSVSYEEIKLNGFLIKQGYIPQLDYLSAVDEAYFGGHKDGK